MTKVQASLATKHGKLAQLSPAFAEVLGWDLVLAEIDTDQFGSFDGSTPRLLSPKETVLAKARAGAEFLGTRFGLASEGTIGQHPSYPLTTSDHELVGFVDLELGTQLVVSHVSPKIFASRLELARGQELPDFASLFDLPHHAVIMSATLGDETKIHKGISSEVEIQRLLQEAFAEPSFARAIIETDFRAMHSPSRQRNIEACAHLAALRLSQRCPSCDYFGWGVTGHHFGLACRDCGFENQHLAKTEIFGCLSCPHEINRELDRKFAEPQNCLSCNP